MMSRAKLKTFGLILCLGGALGVSACRQDMHDNPRYEAYEDGNNRQLPEGTVARGSLDIYPASASVLPPTTTKGPLNMISTAEGQVPIPAGEEGFPFNLKDASGQVDQAKLKAILDRGQSRFNISCVPCHGALGDGNGMVAMRGFRHPPSYHEERLLRAPASHFYDVMTNGYGDMSSYTDQLTPEDRWKVAAYIRVLQMSQNMKMSEMSEDEKQKVMDSENAAAHSGEGHENQNKGKVEERAPAQSVAPRLGEPSGPVSPEKTGGHNNR